MEKENGELRVVVAGVRSRLGFNGGCQRTFPGYRSIFFVVTTC